MSRFRRTMECALGSQRHENEVMKAVIPCLCEPPSMSTCHDRT